MPGSAIFRMVKTASAAVTGFPSSHTASGRSVITYSRPSGGNLHARGEPGHETQGGIEVEEIALDVLEDLGFRQARLQDRVQTRRLPEEPALERPPVDGDRGALAQRASRAGVELDAGVPGRATSARAGGASDRPRQAAASTRTVNAAHARLIACGLCRSAPVPSPGELGASGELRAPGRRPSRRCGRSR